MIGVKAFRALAPDDKTEYFKSLFGPSEEIDGQRLSMAGIVMWGNELAIEWLHQNGHRNRSKRGDHLRSALEWAAARVGLVEVTGFWELLPAPAVEYVRLYRTPSGRFVECWMRSDYERGRESIGELGLGFNWNDDFYQDEASARLAIEREYSYVSTERVPSMVAELERANVCPDRPARERPIRTAGQIHTVTKLRPAISPACEV